MYKKDEIIDISEMKNLNIYSNGYVYYYTKVKWDSEKQRSTDDRVVIGKLVSKDDKTKMYPNHRYRELFPKTEAVILEEPGKVDNYLHFGAYMILVEASSKFGLLESLIKNFSKQYKKILALAISFIDSEDSTSQHFNKWAFSNYSGLTTSMTPSMITELYQSIDQNSIDDFLDDYTTRYTISNPLKGKRCIAFDSTNQNTSADKITSAEFGHAKVDEGLPVISTALLVDEKTGIPVFYEHFNGSLLDKTQVPKSMERIEELGLDKVFLMNDRGYFSGKAIKSLNKFDFGIMTPSNNIDANAIIDKYQPHIFNDNYYITEENIYGVKADKKIEIEGISLTAHVFYDPIRAAEELNIIHNKLSFCEHKMSEIKYYSTEVEKKYGKYFKIIKNNPEAKKTGFTFVRRNDVINAEIKRNGMFVILTNTRITTKEMIIIARQRDKCEKGFKRIKSHFDLSKPLVHNDKTYIGKMFVAFVGLAIVETYRYHIRDLLKATSSETTYTTIAELSKLIAYRKKDGKWTLRYALTKRVKEIISRLGFDEKKVVKFVENLTTV